MQSVRFLRQFGTRIIRRNHSSHDVHPQTTMNDLPAPKGDWQAHYDQNQKKYNRDLILGTLALGATLAFGQYMGFHRLYNDIPELPAEVPNYRVDN